MSTSGMPEGHACVAREQSFSLIFGTRLKRERERMGLSQAAFGRIGGVGKNAQVNYEAGRRLPDALYLSALSAAGCDVALMLGRKEQGGNAPIKEPIDIDRLRQAIDMIEVGLDRTGHDVTSAQKAELVVVAYAGLPD